MKTLTYRQLLIRLRKRSMNKFVKLMAAEKLLEIDRSDSFAELQNVKQHSRVMDEWITSHKEFTNLFEFTKKQKIDLDEKIVG